MYFAVKIASPPVNWCSKGGTTQPLAAHAIFLGGGGGGGVERPADAIW